MRFGCKCNVNFSICKYFAENIIIFTLLFLQCGFLVCYTLLINERSYPLYGVISIIFLSVQGFDFLSL